MEEKNKKYPEGHFVGIWTVIWIAIFTAVGIPISIITKNPGIIGIWPALGVAVGLSIGQGVENKYKKEGKIRALTESEKKNKKNAITIGIITLCLGIIFFAIILFINI